MAEALADRAQEMRDSSKRVTENMANTSATVEQNASAAAEMRSTTDHVSGVMLPIAATAAQNAATAQDASTATQQLAMGIAEIEFTASSLRDQAAELESLVRRFTFKRETKRETPKAARNQPERLSARV